MPGRKKNETAFGRLVADALRNATNADIALVNAGAFKSGTLKAGDVSAAQINALLAFPNDGVGTVTLSGEQLRAALERAVQAYPTGTTAFLHGSGFSAGFNTQAPTNQRLTMLRVNGREVQNDDSFSVAMPTPLAEGGTGDVFEIFHRHVIANWLGHQMHYGRSHVGRRHGDAVRLPVVGRRPEHVRVHPPGVDVRLGRLRIVPR